jgi:hypothetical protein
MEKSELCTKPGFNTGADTCRGGLWLKSSQIKIVYTTVDIHI